jgi:hypothetical protein
MATVAKRPIKDLLDADEKRALEAIYKGFRVPTDQLRRASDVLRAIAATFDRSTSRRIETGVLLRYMFNRRKDKDWPKLGRRAEKFPSMLNLLPPDQIAALEKVYGQIGRPVDEYQFRPSLARDLAERFARMTGVKEEADVLVAIMTARRKRGMWPALFEEQVGEKGKPFSDIAEVHKKYKSA